MSSQPGGPEPNDTNRADQRLDELDLEILAAIKDHYLTADPVPPELDERVLFAIGLDDLDVEVARLQPDALAGSGARGEPRTRTLTFNAGDLAIMLSLAELGGDLVRLDGWLAPAGARRLELRLAVHPARSVRSAGSARRSRATRSAVADEAGRFAFDRVPRGLAQVLVHPAGPGAPGVVTPAIAL